MAVGRQCAVPPPGGELVMALTCLDHAYSITAESDRLTIRFPTWSFASTLASAAAMHLIDNIINDLIPVPDPEMVESADE